jgi:hypothetical protein
VKGLVRSTYPDWVTLPAERKERVLQFLYRFNPALRDNASGQSEDYPLPLAPMLLPDWRIIAGELK